MSSTRFALAAGLATAALLPSLAMAQASAYSSTLLSNPLGGSTYSVAAINNAGQIAGTAYDTYSVDMGGTTYVLPRPHAVVWSAGGQADLGAYSTANGINNAGQVVGNSAVSQPWFGQAMVWNGTTGTALGGSAQALAINDAGQAVGYTYEVYHSAYDGTHATGWGGAASMPSLGGAMTQANDINANGVAVGSSQINVCAVYCTSQDRAMAPYHAVVWQNGQVQDLGLLAGSKSTEALGINNQGVIVGNATLADYSTHALTWTSAGMVDLGAGHASQINNAGLIVGGRAGHAMLWNGTTAIDLNSLASLGPDWVLASAIDINDVGQIIGNAYNAGLNVYTPFLLTPSAVPEPGTFGLSLLGLIGLGQIARRRKAA